MPEKEEIVSIEDIEAARDRIADVIHETPLDVSNTFTRMTGANEVQIKLENMQRTGAYKIRGAYNKISRLPEADLENGIVASSAGNHAQGVAFAAQKLGVDATIVMPEVTPAAKIEATRGYGADVVIHGDIYERSYERALELADEQGMTFIHPFDEPDIIAGQGTIGLEVYEEYPDVETMLIAVGGGGLISGIATALKTKNPDIRIIGVQTEGTAHVNESLDRGEIYEREEIDTITEGIAASRMGDNTFRLVRDRVDEIVEVDDVAVTRALALLAERTKTVAEAAGAVPVAALLSEVIDVEGENVVALVSGGNINLTDHGELTKLGLMHLDRYTRVRIALTDWPASLGGIGDTIEKHGAELKDVRREPLSPDVVPNRSVVTIGIEGSGEDHLHKVIAALDGLDAIDVVDR